MTKQKIEVEIDVPDGFEFVRCYSLAQNLIMTEVNPGEETHFDPVSGLLIVIRSAWQWPEWLTAEWIAMDKYGGWWGYHGEPYIDEDEWWDDEDWVWLTSPLLAFTPPPCTDWRTSKRRNPRSKA